MAWETSERRDQSRGALEAARWRWCPIPVLVPDSVLVAVLPKGMGVEHFFAAVCPAWAEAMFEWIERRGSLRPRRRYVSMADDYRSAGGC